MELAVLCTFILTFCVVVMALAPLGRRADHMVRRVGRVADIGKAAAMEAELARPIGERFFRPALDALVRALSRSLTKGKNAKLEAALKSAGISSRPSEYRALQLVVMMGLSIVMGALAFANIYSITNALGIAYDPLVAVGLTLALALLGGLVGMILMTYRLQVLTRTRKTSIQRQLPEVLDLLSVSVEAGLGFDAALLRVTERARGPLIEELKTAYREITLGRTRSEALRALEARTGLDEVKTFVSAIIQAEQLGISLRNVLRSQATQMRLLKRQRVEERAMKAPVKIMIPMALFIFPVLFILLMGPAVVNIITTFTGG